MKITSIASSSKGCCYVVESGGFQIIIDCGVNLDRIKKALNFNLTKVVCCLVSHDHADHSGFLDKLEVETGIKTYTTRPCIKRTGIVTAQSIGHKRKFNPSPLFSVLPLRMVHDVECYGFLITTEKEKLLYATDTGEIPYQIPGLTHLMIEANHDFKRLIDSDEKYTRFVSERHLSITQVEEFVKAHPDLKEIHLLHLSDGHSNAAEFKKRIQAISGRPVYIAEK